MLSFDFKLDLDSILPLEKNSEILSLNQVDKTLIAIGGYDNLKTLEYIDLENGNEWKTKQMPFTAYCHCSVAISDSEIMVIGGLSGEFDMNHGGNTSSRTTRILNTKTWEFRIGPSMNEDRRLHGCAIKNGTIYVAGGKNGPFHYCLRWKHLV